MNASLVRNLSGPARLRKAWAPLGLTALLLAPVGAEAVPTPTTEPFFPDWPAELQTDVAKMMRKARGMQLSLYIKDLSSGVRFTHHGATPVYLASGIKIPVMVAAFRAEQDGRLRFDESLEYTDDDIRDGAPILNYIKPGRRLTLQFLMETMIQHSDNAATDMMIRRVGLNKVNQVLAEEGIFGFGPITSLIDVRRLAYQYLDPRTAKLTARHIFELGTTRPLEARIRKLEQLLAIEPNTFGVSDYHRAFMAYYKMGYNTARIESMGELLERIAKKQLIDEPTSQRMLDVLKKTKTGVRRFRRGLPQHIPLAHKTGTQYRRICDFSIMFLNDDRPVILAACVKGGKRKRAEYLLASVAARAFNHLVPASERVSLAPPPPKEDNPAQKPENLSEDDLLDWQANKAPAKKRRRKRGRKTLGASR